MVRVVTDSRATPMPGTGHDGADFLSSRTRQPADLIKHFRQ